MLDEQVERTLAEQIFFPTRVRVMGPRVSFFVPEEFLGSQAQPTWGYAVAVTGASLNRRMELPALFGQNDKPTEGLMVLDIRPGMSAEHFGGGRLGDLNQSPVVDLLVPEGVRQQEVLGPRAKPWPAVVPMAPVLPQAPDAGTPAGEGGAPGPGVL
jgi:hypothetical protein